MIAIVNYGSGNIQAIANIYGRLGAPFTVATNPDDLASAERIILPGVGAFDEAMGELNASGMRRALDDCALVERKPILGICVGMQLLGRSSEEGRAQGLGWIDAEVRRFRATTGPAIQVPHMGWNTVVPTKSDTLFDGVEIESGYYFLHSYYMSCTDPADVLARTDYGGEFTCAVRRGNICGVQFHPEKSHHWGAQLLKNFAEL